jgi:hypothetical protein
VLIDNVSGKTHIWTRDKTAEETMKKFYHCTQNIVNSLVKFEGKVGCHRMIGGRDIYIIGVPVIRYNQFCEISEKIVSFLEQYGVYKTPIFN